MIRLRLGTVFLALLFVWGTQVAAIPDHTPVRQPLKQAAGAPTTDAPLWDSAVDHELQPMFPATSSLGWFLWIAILVLTLRLESRRMVFTDLWQRARHPIWFFQLYSLPPPTR